MKALTAVIICIILVTFPLKPDMYAAYEDLQEYREELKSYISTLKADISAGETRLTELDQELARLEKEYGRLLARRRSIEERIRMKIAERN